MNKTIKGLRLLGILLLGISYVAAVVFAAGFIAFLFACFFDATGIFDLGRLLDSESLSLIWFISFLIAIPAVISSWITFFKDINKLLILGVTQKLLGKIKEKGGI